jgi:hypothetical protein
MTARQWLFCDIAIPVLLLAGLKELLLTTVALLTEIRTSDRLAATLALIIDDGLPAPVFIHYRTTDTQRIVDCVSVNTIRTLFWLIFVGGF